MRLPRLLFGASHPGYHFMMFCIAVVVLAIVVRIAMKVGAL